jgi:hypothetical protein
MKYLHVARFDDRTQTGLTFLHESTVRRWFRWNWRFALRPSADYGRIRFGWYRATRIVRDFGIRIVVVLPTPFRKVFTLDHGRYHAWRGVNWWVCFELTTDRLPQLHCGESPRLA